MAIEELTSEQIEELVGQRHAVTGMAYPANGLQPYYQWLIRTLHLLAESSAGALRVCREAGSSTQVCVAPGRASIAEVALAYSGGVFDLGPWNNQTVYLWLYDAGAGAGAVGVGAAGDGWPVYGHIKLAEVVVESGAVAGVLDRRFETVFKA